MKFKDVLSSMADALKLREKDKSIGVMKTSRTVDKHLLSLLRQQKVVAY